MLLAQENMFLMSKRGRERTFFTQTTLHLKCRINIKKSFSRNFYFGSRFSVVCSSECFLKADDSMSTFSPSFSQSHTHIVHRSIRILYKFAKRKQFLMIKFPPIIGGDSSSSPSTTPKHDITHNTTSQTHTQKIITILVMKHLAEFEPKKTLCLYESVQIFMYLLSSTAEEPNRSQRS